MRPGASPQPFCRPGASGWDWASGALDEGVAHIVKLIAAEAVLLIAHTHALKPVLGHIAPVDGEIVGAGGELDVPRLAAVLGVKQPEGRDLVDLFQENFIHKASPSGIIAQFSRKSKCFSPTDSHRNKKAPAEASAFFWCG